jgi:hypothetical protein
MKFILSGNQPAGIFRVQWVADTREDKNRPGSNANSIKLHHRNEADQILFLFH